MTLTRLTPILSVIGVKMITSNQTKTRINLLLLWTAPNKTERENSSTTQAAKRTQNNNKYQGKMRRANQGNLAHSQTTLIHAHLKI